MDILDIHTHNSPSNPSEAIINCFPQDFSPQDGYYYSVGYHPWYISADGSEDWNLLDQLASHPQVLAIGETGLDKLKGVDLPIQEEAFRKQVAIAEAHNKPVIIHTVRTSNEIIRYKKELNPEIPWIIHGFRGKKELAQQLSDHGFYLSFGEKYQADALQSVPLDRLFIETDESPVDIHTLYERAASTLSLPVDSLICRIRQNISNVFFK